MISEQTIREILEKLFESDDITSMPADKLFKDQGLDSIDLFTVIVELQAISGIDVPDSELDRLTSIRSLAEYFR